MGALRRQWRAASAESSIEIEGFHVPASEQVGVVSGAEPLDPSDENRSVHPFRDGNGRIARIVQSLVLARDGLLAPEFVSIEEYLGRNTDAYYAVLQEVQGGRYQPDRDAGPWVRFCVRAHVEQAHRRLDQIAEAGRRWARLEQLVADRGWPDRLVIALEERLARRRGDLLGVLRILLRDRLGAGERLRQLAADVVVDLRAVRRTRSPESLAWDGCSRPDRPRCTSRP